jgi:hypothetical protein
MRFICFVLPYTSITSFQTSRTTTIPIILRIRTMSSTNVNLVAHEAPWHAAYPVPRSEAVEISQSELLAMMQDGQEPGKDFILVDLRKNDHAVRDKTIKLTNLSDISSQGGTIAGSLNLPAQSLYPSIPTLYTLFKAAGVSKVIWYCGKFSSYCSKDDWRLTDPRKVLPRDVVTVLLHGLQIMRLSRGTRV